MRTTRSIRHVPPAPSSGSDVLRAFLPTSPFVAHLGIELLALGDGRATLRLPFRDEVVTIGRVVHGGAIATLADTAVMAAAWAGAEVPERLRGSTVSLTVSYLTAAEAEDLLAQAVVLRRGRRLVDVEVDVRTASGALAAKALATYQLG